MDVKNCLPLQRGGLGDICFLQKAAKHLINQGYNIIWPVLPQLLYIKDYVKVKNLNFISTEAPLPEIEKAIDFGTADQHFQGSVLKAKYHLISLDWSDWSDYFTFERNHEKE